MLNILKDRVISVDILVAIFGISSWIAINGVWVETPVIFQTLPEKFNLGCYIVLTIQGANIGPVIYSLLKYKFSLKTIEGPAIHLTLLIGSIACLLLSIFWDRITVINGSQHSVVFLTLIGLLAIVDCTTTVLYIPFMTRFKPKYLMPHLIGQGLSSFIPSIFAIIQGMAENPKCVDIPNANITVPEYSEPRFSVSVFFIILIGVIAMSWSAFIALNYVKYFQTERVFMEGANDDRPLQTLQKMPRKSLMVLLAAQTYITAFSNGILPSIQSYSCLAYGNTSYHLAVNLSLMASPIAYFIAIYLSTNTFKRTLPFSMSLGTVCALYIISSALMSPTPPLYDRPLGKVAIVLVWVANNGLFSYSQACISSIFRNTDNGHKYLFISGVFTQLGSTIGAITTFVILQYTDILTPFIPCI